MNKTFLTIYTLLMLLFMSCHKADNNQYSYWRVNNDSFQTNDVSIIQGHMNCDFNSKNTSNGFGFNFNSKVLPTGILLKLDCSEPKYEWVCFAIKYHDTSYLAKVDEGHFISATIKNGKACYTLDKTWLFNMYRPTDSILASGTFNEP